MESTQESKEIVLLDDKGCLTPEALCFADQLSPQQRAVVERHTHSCNYCAQQQTDMARISGRMQGIRPRVPLPNELKTLARQTILRSLAHRQKHQHSRATAKPFGTIPNNPPFATQRWNKLKRLILLAIFVILCVLTAILTLIILDRIHRNSPPP